MAAPMSMVEPTETVRSPTVSEFPPGTSVPPPRITSEVSAILPNAPNWSLPTLIVVVPV